MNVVFIGDSFTSGENNNYKSFAHYYKYLNIENTVSILGVSGSCFGDYSIYPVQECCFSLLKQYSFIRSADLIVIDFGINDTTAVTVGYVDLLKVYISIIRCMDLLKQLNPDVKLLFIFPFSESFKAYIDTYLMYVYSDYFNNSITPIYEDKIQTFQNIYFRIVTFVKSMYEVVFMDQLINPFDFMGYLDNDMIHLNDDGYKLLGNNLYLYIEDNYDKF